MLRAVSPPRGEHRPDRDGWKDRNVKDHARKFMRSPGRLGILSRPLRTTAGYRRYDEWVVEELDLVKAVRSLGFSLKEVKAILGVVRAGPAPCSPVLEVARRRLAEIDDVLAALKRKRTALAAAIVRCVPRPLSDHRKSLATDILGTHRGAAVAAIGDLSVAAA